MADPRSSRQLRVNGWQVAYVAAIAATLIVPPLVYVFQPAPEPTPLTLRAGLRAAVEQVVPPAPANDAAKPGVDGSGVSPLAPAPSPTERSGQPAPQASSDAPAQRSDSARPAPSSQSLLDAPRLESRHCYYVDGYASFLDMPVKDGTVIISARSKGGNAYITHAPLGGPNGRFTSGCIPRDYELDNPSKDPSSPKDPLARIELSMAADAVAFAPESLRSWVRTPVRGTTTITRHGTGTLTHERTYLPRWVLALSICVLVCGLYGSILGVRRLGRLASIGVSLGITVGAIVMLGVIVSAYLYIISVYRDGGIVMQTSVGYLTRETFHDNIPADWIFSLSLPSREGDEKHIVGFGAPLWAILLGSIGACITAFQHLVRTPFDLEEATSETAQATDAANAGSPLEAAESAVAPAESDPPPVKDSTPPAESDAPPAENDSAEDDSPPENSKVPAPAQAGDSNLSKDRFSEQNALTGAKADQLLSIAFAPLGSIFVYQALILLDFTEFVIIATIMLASGLSLNILVSIAFQRARSIIHAAIVKADPASRS